MRDSHIYAGMAQTEAKVAHDVQLLAEQVRIVRFRQEAIEEALFGNRVRGACVALLMVLSPRTVRKLIDHLMQVESDRFDQMMRDMDAEQAKKAKGILLPKGVGVIQA